MLQNALLSDLLIRLAMDLIAVWVMVRGIYFGVYRTRDLFFTLIVTNLVIFLLSYSLNGSQFSLGAAFGLFAVFGMLRFRTEDISIKDMTYLFLAIAFGVFAAVAQMPWWMQGLVLGGILGITALLESNLLYRRESVKSVLYDKPEMLQKASNQDIIDDLKARTGLPVHRFQVVRVDLLRDTVQLKVYYFE
ncbi:MAG: DUF4956 domain-containing protein [Bacteroidota bacterium]